MARGCWIAPALPPPREGTARRPPAREGRPFRRRGRDSAAPRQRAKRGGRGSPLLKTRVSGWPHPLDPHPGRGLPGGQPPTTSVLLGGRARGSPPAPRGRRPKGAGARQRRAEWGGAPRTIAGSGGAGWAAGATRGRKGPTTARAVRPRVLRRRLGLIFGGKLGEGAGLGLGGGFGYICTQMGNDRRCGDHLVCVVASKSPPLPAIALECAVAGPVEAAGCP